MLTQPETKKRTLQTITMITGTYHVFKNYCRNLTKNRKESLSGRNITFVILITMEKVAKKNMISGI